MFHEVTAGTDIFSGMADESVSVEEKARVFLKKLNDIFHKTFKKTRINSNLQKKNSTDEYMKIKTKLKIYIRNCQNDE